MDILERYIKEIEEDLKIDEFNIKDASLRSPGRKHFWVSRLIHHKRSLLSLENQRNTLIKQISKELQMQAIVKLSNPTIEKAVIESNSINHRVFRKDRKNVFIAYI